VSIFITPFSSSYGVTFFDGLRSDLRVSRKKAPTILFSRACLTSDYTVEELGILRNRGMKMEWW
jgi:hypothetical protein